MGALRLLLAGLVIIAHSSPVFGWRGLGGNAVTAFFVISGYYMAFILNQKYRTKGGLWLFYSNRALRLFPLYFFFLFIYLLLSSAAQTGVPIIDRTVHMAQKGLVYATDGSVASLFAVIPNLFFLGADVVRLFLFDVNNSNFVLWRSGVQETANIRGAYQYLVMPHIWSLGVEIVFYALAPLLAQLKLARLVLAFGALFSVQQMLSFWIEGLAWLHLLSLWNMSFFVLGMLAFRLTPWLVTPKRRFAVPLALIPFAIALFVQGSMWPAWVLFALGLPALFSVTKFSALDKTLGSLSYPVYLCHFLFAWPASVAFGQFGSLVAMLVSCALSWIAVQLIDAPIEKWRERRVRGSRRDDAGTTV